MSRVGVAEQAEGVSPGAQLRAGADRLVGADPETDAAVGLDVVVGVLAQVDRVMAAVVDAVAAADPREASAGLGVAGYLRLFGGRTGGDAGMLCAAAERLVHLPTVARLFREGAVSWAVVRGIVVATRSLTVAQLAWVDETVAARAEHFAGMDADRQVGVVDELAERARPDLVRDREARAVERTQLRLQAGLDGSLTMFGQFDAESGAVILERLAAPPRGERDPDQHDERDERGEDPQRSDPADPDGRAASRQRRQADRLVAACRHRCTSDGENRGGDDAASEPRGGTATRVGAARPSMLVLTPVETLAEALESRSGRLAQLLWRSAKGPVRLSPAAVQRLGCDARVRQVFTLDGQVLGVGPERDVIPPAVRAALIARDVGCRFPSWGVSNDLCRSCDLRT